MIEIPEREVSLWVESAGAKKYPKLEGDMQTDTVIVGGGIAGLTTAYLLSASGQKVVVVEKDRIGQGITGHTTGKITSQHGLCYGRLFDNLGEEDARNYGQANQEGLELIRRITTAENIECEFQDENNYVFTEDEKSIKDFQKEAEVAEKLGLPAKFVSETPLPFPVKAAVRFEGQAKFHPGKYLAGLAEAIIRKGGQIFEDTKAGHIVDGEKVRVKAREGNISAKELVIATNVPYPWLAHGYYCALEYPLKSYIVACRTRQSFKGMYITPGRMPFSILPIKDNLILIGGRSHVPGLTTSVRKRFRFLAEYAQMNFDVESIDYIWSARDYLGYDDKPLVGKLYPWSKHVYAMTGFMKWGLTNATAAAILLKDIIEKNDNSWRKTFDPARFKAVTSIPRATAKYFS